MASPIVQDKQHSLKSLIAEAIQERRLIRLSYDGLTKTVEPHVLGVTRKKEQLALLCWQVWPPMRQAGFWRALFVSNITNLEVLDTLIEDEPEGPPPPVFDFSTTDAVLRR